MVQFVIDDIHTKLLKFQDNPSHIDTLLEFCTENDCSDLYIKIGERPYLMRYGAVIEIPSFPVSEIDWNIFADDAISSELNHSYVVDKMLDFSYEIKMPDDSKFKDYGDSFRYRVSAGYSESRNIATFRMITPEPPSFKKINYAENDQEILRTSLKNRSGIMLFCGPTGSGKTTSLAACVNDFTAPGEPLDNSIIITLENPIEYQFVNKPNCKITQKEILGDFTTFTNGVTQALREHPTHIICGEIRDRDGIRTCVEAARTGHKVMSTFHTDDVAGTVARMYNYLASDENSDIMYDLITNIDMIICQKLFSDGESFNLKTQYLFFNDEVKHLLHNAISNNYNISLTIQEIFRNEDFLKAGIIKDWS